MMRSSTSVATAVTPSSPDLPSPSPWSVSWSFRTYPGS